MTMCCFLSVLFRGYRSVQTTEYMVFRRQRYISECGVRKIYRYKEVIETIHSQQYLFPI